MFNGQTKDVSKCVFLIWRGTLLKVAIINITGYAGSELARILLKHPDVEITSVTGRSGAGKYVSEIVPSLWQLNLIVADRLDQSVDFVFSALPSGVSSEVLVPLINSGIKAVDIAADFRLKNPSDFSKAYSIEHPFPNLLKDSVYGLSEIYREQICGANLVANPGCFPSAAILALAPALNSGLIDGDIIVDAKTGISGAGRGGMSSNVGDNFSEANENIVVYGMDGHAHQVEITQELALLSGGKTPRVTFIPHRVPMTRGILTTCYASLKSNVDPSVDIRGVYRDFYVNEPFVRVADNPPQTKQTTGSNMCLVYPKINRETGRLVIVSCLDNLVKGAAGQAVQNMNIMSRFSEMESLSRDPLYP